MEIPSFHLRTVLICGFLGAGKTTFILDQLKSAGGKTAVLVNEFGALGIDGTLIGSVGGVEVVEMPGGCICCSQQAGLVESIRTIAGEIRPEVLLIEPSGVAEVSEVSRILEEESLTDVVRLDAVITVIDASTFLRFSEPEAFGTFFLDQITNADLVVVNKTDLVSTEELEQIDKRLLELNPTALVVPTAFCRMETPLPSGRKRSVRSFGRSGPAMEWFSIVPEGSLSDRHLKKLAAALSEDFFGQIFRGKGLLRVEDRGWVNLQIVGSALSVTPFPEEVQPRLTLIGHDLDGQRIENFFDLNQDNP